jgi:osmotically-inducible protein OsmY
MSLSNINFFRKEPMKKTILFVLASGLFLQGCVPVVVVGAAAGAGGATYYGRSGLGQFLDDSAIVKEGYRRIGRNSNLNHGTHLIVASKNGRVLLAGQVPSPALKDEAVNTLRSIEGVKNVFNQITVSGPTSDLVRSSDSWITAKIKSQLVLAKEIPANQIKVITENGVVYLMGTIPPEAQEKAVDVARQVVGVQKVVKLFE